MTRAAPISTNSRIRTGMWRTSSQLVTQAVSTQTHQMARNSIAGLDEAERIGMDDDACARPG